VILAVHVLGGIILVALTVGVWMKAARIEQDPTADWSEALIRLVTRGQTLTRDEWIKRLRLVYRSMGVLTFLIAVLL